MHPTETPCAPWRPQGPHAPRRDLMCPMESPGIHAPHRDPMCLTETPGSLWTPRRPQGPHVPPGRAQGTREPHSRAQTWVPLPPHRTPSGPCSGGRGMAAGRAGWAGGSHGCWSWGPLPQFGGVRPAVAGPTSTRLRQLQPPPPGQPPVWSPGTWGTVRGTLPPPTQCRGPRCQHLTQGPGLLLICTI